MLCCFRFTGRAFRAYEHSSPEAEISDTTIVGNRAGPALTSGAPSAGPTNSTGGSGSGQQQNASAGGSLIATGGGGGVYIVDVQVQMRRVQVSGNGAGLQGGGIHVASGQLNHYYVR